MNATEFRSYTPSATKIARLFESHLAPLTTVEEATVGLILAAGLDTYYVNPDAKDKALRAALRTMKRALGE